MYCKLNDQVDYPLRAQMDGREVLHACRNTVAGLISVCGVYLDSKCEKEKGSLITCINCQRGLGFLNKDATNVRYLLKDVSTNTFFKRDKGTGIWVSEAFDATRWMTYEGVAGAINQIVFHRKYAKFNFENSCESEKYCEAIRRTLEIKKGYLRIELEE